MTSYMHGINNVDELTPYLYLTSVYGATRENVLRKGITLIVNAAQELPKQEVQGVESIKLFLDDTPYALINVYFDRIADKIHEHSNRGGRVIVHCVMGVSRSTTLCIAYLMKYRNMNLKSAFEYISYKRPCVRPNPGFWNQLIDYEKQIMQSNRYLNYLNDEYKSLNSSSFYRTHENQTSQSSNRNTVIPIHYKHSDSNNSSKQQQQRQLTTSKRNSFSYANYEPLEITNVRILSDDKEKMSRSRRSQSASRSIATQNNNLQSKLYKMNENLRRYNNHIHSPSISFYDSMIPLTTASQQRRVAFAFDDKSYSKSSMHAPQHYSYKYNYSIPKY